MRPEDQSAETFATLYLRGKKLPRGRLKPAVQTDLFSAPVALAIQQHPGSPGAADDQAPESSPRLWAVRELVSAIRFEVERAHFAVWVEGEVSNCRLVPSGHLYFTLKDGEAQLPVVLFRRQAQLLGAHPKDGDAVEVRGRVSIYESRGQLQLIAETLELRGAGALELAFKQLKGKLQAEGLFSQKRKRSLPAFPQCLGVITSPTGAVLRDILQVVRRRHSCLNILVYPATMQGVLCARSVAEGIRWFNRNPDRVDLILLARGGGSIEDLAGFNDEALARTIVASALPIVSAIGHETDFTIADLVADLRAPTPSAAAELVTAAQHRIEDRVWELGHRVLRAGRFQMMAARQHFTVLGVQSALLRLRDAVSRRGQRLDDLETRLGAGGHRRLRAPALGLERLLERLRRQDPAIRLATAGTRLRASTARLERLRLNATAPQRLRLERAVERLRRQHPAARFAAAAMTLRTATGRLLRTRNPLLVAQNRHVELALERLRRVALTASGARRLERARTRLGALSPLAVLDRGYALVYLEDGTDDGPLLRQASAVLPGQGIRARLATGSVIATVRETTG